MTAGRKSVSQKIGARKRGTSRRIFSVSDDDPDVIETVHTLENSEYDF